MPQKSFNIDENSEIYHAGQLLIDSTLNYCKAFAHQINNTTILWVTDTSGRLIIITSEQYRDALLANIADLKKEDGRVTIEYTVIPTEQEG